MVAELPPSRVRERRSWHLFRGGKETGKSELGLSLRETQQQRAEGPGVRAEPEVTVRGAAQKQTSGRRAER